MTRTHWTLVTTLLMVAALTLSAAVAQAADGDKPKRDGDRAAKREGGFEALSAYVRSLIDEAPLQDGLTCLERAGDLLDAAKSDPSYTRAAASALYHVTTAAMMTWEAHKVADPHRARLARMVLDHRVLPRDPLATGADEDLATLLDMA